MKILFHYDFNWADEFDVFGYQIMTVEQYNKFEEVAKKYFEENDNFSTYFGSNQDLQIESFGELFAGNPQQISDEEAETITRLVGESQGLLRLDWIAESMEDSISEPSN